MGDNHLVHTNVIHHQHRTPCKLNMLTVRHITRAPPLSLPLFERNLKLKNGALTGHTGETDVTAHQIHQVLTDSQAQTRTFKAAFGRSVGLNKRVKQGFLCLQWDTDTRILYFKVCIAILPFYTQYNSTQVGKLNRITNQIHQYLRDPFKVADEKLWYAELLVDGKMYPLFRGFSCKHTGQCIF